MLDGQSWRTGLVASLKGLLDVYGSLPSHFSAARFLDIELVCTLLTEYLPDENPELAWAILNGYFSPAFARLTSESQQAVKIARLRLPDLLGRGRWERDFELYRVASHNDGSVYPLYTFDETMGKLALRPTSILPHRLERMKEALKTPPNWQVAQAKFADQAGVYRFYQDKYLHEVEISQTTLNLYTRAKPPQLSMNLVTTSAPRPALKVTLEELQTEARWMDKHLAATPGLSGDWETRLSRLQLGLFKDKVGLEQGTQLNVNGLLHLVGMVGSGKSTLFTVLAVYLARRGQRVTLVQSDVAGLMRELQIFAALSRADPRLAAVPMIGRSTRTSHLQGLHAVEVQRHGAGMSLGREHPGYAMLSTICPLDGLRQGAVAPIKSGSEPCNRLYPVELESENEEVAVVSDVAENKRNRRDCPLMPLCPTHRPTLQLENALIWLATPASLLVSRPQTPLVANEVRNIELVMRHSDLLLIDEADLVQVQFDNRFAPLEVLIGKSESWLDKLANQVTRQVYRPGRLLVGRNAAFDRWLTAHQNTQRAADCLYRWLRESSENRRWIGRSYFSRQRIFTMLRYELEQLKKLPSEYIQYFESSCEAFRYRTLGSVQNGAESTESNLAPLEWVTAAQLELLEANRLRALAVLRQWFEADQRTKVLNQFELDMLADRLLIAILINVLDQGLQDVIDQWPSAIEFVELDYGTGGLFYRPDENLVKLTPEPAMGAVLGFQYYDPEDKGEGELRFFHIRGIGRDLLYHLHDSYRVSHGFSGPNVILTSGTSWAPGSWRYHLAVQPQAVLLPDWNTPPTVECFFEPLSNPENPAEMLHVSGQSDHTQRLHSLRLIVQQLMQRGLSGKSLLDKEFEDIADSNRRRVLLVVGSYEEAATVGEALITQLREQQANQPFDSVPQPTPEEQVLVLMPDSEADLDLPSPATKLYRSMVQQMAQTPARYLVAPLLAIERGHNILVGQVAALGSVYFLTRPMPVPGDAQTAVQRLNSWALEAIKNPTTPSLGQTGLRLRRQAEKRWDEELAHKDTYTALSDAERRPLLWTQLVLVWQCVGRLLRGGVNARVHFIDGRWMPQYGQTGPSDTARTSMLMGFQSILDEALSDPDLVQRGLAEVLYGAFAEGLANLKIR